MLFTSHGTIACINEFDYKVFVHKGHVVIVPSWPLTAGAVIMTLSIEKEMEVVGKFLFENEEKKRKIDQVQLLYSACKRALINEVTQRRLI